MNEGATPENGTALAGRDSSVLLCADMEKIDRFPVGRAFATKSTGCPVRFGWITGYGINPSGELVFRCRWAHRDGEQLIHPSNVHSVLTDWSGSWSRLID